MVVAFLWDRAMKMPKFNVEMCFFFVTIRSAK
jgi:hypothetical protein